MITRDVLYVSDVVAYQGRSGWLVIILSHDGICM